MITAILTLIVGLCLIVAVPSYLSQKGPSLKGLASIARGAGALIMLFGVASISFVHISQNQTGLLHRIYLADPLPEGRIIAMKGEKGPQSWVLGPGFHFIPFLNVLYDVSEGDVVEVPQGKIAILHARDGASLRSGQRFADPFTALMEKGTDKPVDQGTMLTDAAYFIRNGGQRGQQTTVLKPGAYRMNLFLWKYRLTTATDIPQGFVGVVKSNMHAPVRFAGSHFSDGPKPEDCNPLKLDRPEDSLKTPLVPVGCIGIWEKTLVPGNYFVNPEVYVVTLVDTRAQAWLYKGGYKHRVIDVKLNADGQFDQSERSYEVAVPEGAADEAIAMKAEGWRMRQAARAVVRIAPTDASFVVASVGGLTEAEDRIITPAIQAWLTTLAGGSIQVPSDDGATSDRPTRVLDFMEHRDLISDQLEQVLKREGAKAGVTVKEVRLLEPYFPPELLLPRKRQQLANALVKSFIDERKAQRERIETERERATANEQSHLVKAQIEKQRKQQLADAAIEEGRGVKGNMLLTAEGQLAQAEVLGQDRVMQLQMLDRLLGYFDRHPEVLTAMATQAHKFVPQVQVTSGEGGGLNLTSAAAVLGGILGQDDSPKPAATKRKEEPVASR
ncbi:MAG: SPFH domain-containing protein [Candidatus Electrothrix sp. YB6]